MALAWWLEAWSSLRFEACAATMLKEIIDLCVEIGLLNARFEKGFSLLIFH